MTVNNCLSYYNYVLISFMYTFVRFNTRNNKWTLKLQNYSGCISLYCCVTYIYTEVITCVKFIRRRQSLEFGSQIQHEIWFTKLLVYGTPIVTSVEVSAQTSSCTVRRASLWLLAASGRVARLWQRVLWFWSRLNCTATQRDRRSQRSQSRRLSPEAWQKRPAGWLMYGGGSLSRPPVGSSRQRRSWHLVDGCSRC